MKIVLSYIKTALYNIKRNKAYAIFYILGTTLAFVFIAIILQDKSGGACTGCPLLNRSHILLLCRFEFQTTRSEQQSAEHSLANSYHLYRRFAEARIQHMDPRQIHGMQFCFPHRNDTR